MQGCSSSGETTPRLFLRQYRRGVADIPAFPVPGWDDDVLAQLEQEERSALDVEVDERSRSWRALVSWSARWEASHGRTVVAEAAGTRVEGVVEDASDDWAWLTCRGDVVLLRTPTVSVATGLGLGSARAATGAGRLVVPVGHALRRLADRRDPVTVACVDGGQRTGTMAGVGADWFDLRRHPVDRPAAGTDPVEALAWASVVMIRA